MAMPEFWYEGPSETRDLAASERSVGDHARVLGASVLVLAVIVAALLIALG